MVADRLPTPTSALISSAHAHAWHIAKILWRRRRSGRGAGLGSWILSRLICTAIQKKRSDYCNDENVKLKHFHPAIFDFRLQHASANDRDFFVLVKAKFTNAEDKTGCAGWPRFVRLLFCDLRWSDCDFNYALTRHPDTNSSKISLLSSPFSSEILEYGPAPPHRGAQYVNARPADSENHS